jgi:hypothetical protein
MNGDGIASSEKGIPHPVEADGGFPIGQIMVEYRCGQYVS